MNPHDSILALALNIARTEVQLSRVEHERDKALAEVQRLKAELENKTEPVDES